MNNIQETWETYQSAWKAETEEEKRTILSSVLDEKAVYQDPLAKASSWDELVAYMLEFHQQVPGGHFITTFFQAHNNQCAVKWDMALADGTVVNEGISYCTFNDGGKLTSMTGFFTIPPK